MQMKKIIMGAFILSSLLLIDISAKAEFIKTELPTLTKSGDTYNLKVPDNANKIIENSDQHIKYQLNDGAKLENQANKQDKLIAPITVDSQITSTANQEVEGVTTYTTNLSQAKVIEEKTENPLSLGSAFWGTFLGTKVSASNTTQSVWDQTGAVNFYLTVHWITSGNGVKVISTNGGYNNYDNRITITSSRVEVESSGPSTTGGQWQFQREDFNLGFNRSWSVNVNYVFVLQRALSTHVGAIYYATLKRGNSSWNFQTTNRVF